MSLEFDYLPSCPVSTFDHGSLSNSLALALSSGAQASILRAKLINMYKMTLGMQEIEATE
jgi:hypothetical protein